MAPAVPHSAGRWSVMAWEPLINNVHSGKTKTPLPFLAAGFGKWSGSN